MKLHRIVRESIFSFLSKYTWTRVENIGKLGKLGHHLILSDIFEVSEISELSEFVYSPRESFQYMRSLSKMDFKRIYGYT